MTGVNDDSNPLDVEKNRGISWRSFAEEKYEGTIQKELGILGIPVYLILDEDGTVVHVGHSADPIETGKVHRALEKRLARIGHDVSLELSKLGPVYIGDAPEDEE